MPSSATATVEVMPPSQPRDRASGRWPWRDTGGSACATPRSRDSALGSRHERPPDAWTALRASPWRFLGSRHGRGRSLAYLLTTVPIGLATLVVLALTLVVGVATLVVVVGAVVLAGLPVLAGRGRACVERRRLGLVRQGAPSGLSFRERLRAGRRLPVSWPEVGYAVLVSVVLWSVDVVVLLFAVTMPVVLLISPLAATTRPTRWSSSAGGSTRWAESVLGVRRGSGDGWWPRRTSSAWSPSPRPASPGCCSTRARRELAAAVADLRRSRVDLVDAFETERRRIERDLHDGVQQRLVALTMTLGRAELDVAEGPGLELVRAGAPAGRGRRSTSCADTVRGIHPRVLADHGLAAAVHEIADRSPVPVSVDIRLDERLPAPVEAAAYFVVSEALTNVARHSGARQAAGARVAAGRLAGADRGRRRGRAARTSTVRRAAGWPGSPLRLDALGGELRVTSPPGGPTEVRMEVPVRRPEDRARRGRRAAARGAGRDPRARRPRGRRGRRRRRRAARLRRARELPDVVVTDIRMPPTHTDEGLRAATRIRVEHPRDRGDGAVGVRRRGLRARAARLRPRRRRRLPAQGPGGPRARVPRQPGPGRRRRDRRGPAGRPAAARPAPRRRPARAP